eukprot:CCRYP_008652-RA/>CCRYP_008652-RA protein AED:0.08 eAED:0.08 QI:0/0.75/0.6/1/1/1/5/76/565
MPLENTSFIHFNDVYNVEKAPPFVASVKAAKRSLEHVDSKRHVFTFFSGDAFSPSAMSTVLRGEQMIPVLNALSIDAACLGNHDLDFGLNEFQELKDQCNFPWICSNASDCDDKPLGGCHEYLIIDKDSDSPRILVIGLIETGWLDTLSTVDAGDVIFEAPESYVNRRVPELKEKFGPFDAIVALSHMRMPMDYALAENGVVDIVLGGHDHHYEDTTLNDIRVLNSSTDFKTYTLVDVVGRLDSGVLKTTSRRVDVTPEDPPDPELAHIIKGFEEIVNKGMDVVVGRSKVRLDANFSSIRTKETNIGNFLAEVISRATGADVAILQAGAIRADRFIEPGEITAGDVSDLLPKEDDIILVEITGEQLLFALENGVSKYPATEGRFPCLDGVRFTFDPSRPPGNRVVPKSVYIRTRPLAQKRHSVIRGANLDSLRASEDGHENNGFKQMNKICPESIIPEYSPIDLNRKYSVGSTQYLISGKDGYDKAFEGATVLQDEDAFPPLPTLVRNLFTELRVMKIWSGMIVHGAVVSAATKFKSLARKSVADPYAICPQVDGRISMLAHAYD